MPKILISDTCEYSVPTFRKYVPSSSKHGYYIQANVGAGNPVTLQVSKLAQQILKENNYSDTDTVPTKLVWAMYDVRLLSTGNSTDTGGKSVDVYSAFNNSGVSAQLLAPTRRKLIDYLDNYQGQQQQRVKQLQHELSKSGDTNPNHRQTTERTSTAESRANNSGSNINDDSRRRDPFLLDRMAVVTFELATVSVYAEGNYWQTMALEMDDVEMVEGVLSERLDDEKIKVFGWDRWFDRDDDYQLQPLPGQDTVKDADLPSVESQSAGGDTYHYAVTDSVLEGRDDAVPIGDGELWLSNGKKARTLAKVLSQHGHDVVDEDSKRDDHGWLNAESDDEFQLRDELQGRRLMMWFEQVTIPAEEMDDDQDEDITFTDTVLLDAKTESGITIEGS